MIFLRFFCTSKKKRRLLTQVSQTSDPTAWLAEGTASLPTLAADSLVQCVTSHTTSAGHLKWPGMRTAIGLVQYFALFSVLLSWLVSLDTMLEYALSTCLLWSCVVWDEGVVDKTWRKGQSRPAHRLHRLQEKSWSCPLFSVLLSWLVSLDTMLEYALSTSLLWSCVECDEGLFTQHSGPIGPTGTTSQARSRIALLHLSTSSGSGFVSRLRGLGKLISPSSSFKISSDR